MRASICLILLALTAGLYGCAREAPQEPAASLGEFVDPTAELSALVYHDRSLESLNDHCPIQGGKLGDTIPPVYVNGRPIGFC